MQNTVTRKIMHINIAGNVLNASKFIVLACDAAVFRGSMEGKWIMSIFDTKNRFILYMDS